MKSFRSGIVLAAAVLLAGSMCFAEDGAATYKAKCAMCHAADGTGKAAMKVPSFKTPESIKESDAELTAAIKNGKGTGAVKMPAYAGKLTDPQIKDLVVYVRTLQK